MKNQFQFRAWIFDMAREGMHEDKIFLAVRSGDPELYKVVTTTHDQRGNAVTSPRPLQDMIKKAQEEWEKATPLSKAYQIQFHAELALRGDLQEALSNLSPTTPGDIRDAVSATVKLAQREEWGSTPGESDLADCIGLLKEHGVDVEGFSSRLAQLYPPTDGE